MHVDYWDYIGWKNPFAQSRFSERQRWLSQLASSSTIYTPEVFVGMKELRGWSNAPSLENRIRAINREPAQARIELQMTATGANTARLEAHFALDTAVRPGHSAQAIVVLYEKQIATDVRAGENKGAKLSHDNVVRYWSEPLLMDARTGRAEWRQTVELAASWKRQNLGLAALVQDTKAGNVLQALSMPGCV